jgi:hypothetical protein
VLSVEQGKSGPFPFGHQNDAPMPPTLSHSIERLFKNYVGGELCDPNVSAAANATKDAAYTFGAGEGGV